MGVDRIKTKMQGPFIMPRALGLVDYEDDEDDEDYNPPRRSPSSASNDGDTLADLCKPKRTSSSTDDSKDLVFEGTKKRRLGQHSREFSAAEVNSNHGENTNKPELSPSSGSRASESNGELNEHGKERACLPERSNSSPSTPDTRQFTGEDSKLTQIGSTTPEITVNGSNVSSSEPYSVR
ncbi:hypothetical protein KSP40_PGU008271 [Platanthera guangdongensis]|uniref:Uncharacterized protein n=1 Tax=Platanthera guangdongensis TaxID=2320717 RepID=A0ABR2MZJ4_9ASPA